MHRLTVLSVLFFIMGIFCYGLAYHNIDLSLWCATTGFSDINLVRIQSSADLYMGGMFLWILGILLHVLSYSLVLIYITTIKR